MRGELLVYVGTYTEAILFGTGQVFQGKGEGIYIYVMDRATGAMRLRKVVTGVKNPSYLAFAPDGRHLYAVNELKSFEGKASGSLSAFEVDPSDGDLRFLNSRPTGGTDPCHVEVDRRGEWVFVANFASGSVSVFPIESDGSLGTASDFVQHQGSSVDPKRQAGPHAHSTVLDAANGLVFVPDLGMDRLMVYRFDAERGKLTPHDHPWVQTGPGAGPRHLDFHPTRPYAYLINELNSTIGAYEYDRSAGRFKEVHNVATLPKGFAEESSCADIHIHPSGEYLYGSNRGHDSIVIYRIDQATGRLSLVGHESTQGETPRNFAIDPSGDFLLAANQKSDSIVVFHIDRKTGKLTSTGQIVRVPNPVCVKFNSASAER